MSRSNDPLLFRPVTLRSLEVPHRLWVAPMGQHAAEDGVPQAWHLVHLGSFAIGRAGLIMTEATAVNPEGRTSAADAGLWNDEQAAGWRGIVDFCHSQRVPVAVQLVHAGRKAWSRPPFRGRGSVSIADGGWRTVAPSALAHGARSVPRELPFDEIQRIVEDFVRAARRATAAGFDGVEIHAAHGYLPHQFLSPLSNHRTDVYGGGPDNRSRFLRGIVSGVRKAIPDGMPLFVRISADEWVAGGWGVEDAQRLVQQLESLGVDLISISSGGNDPRQAIDVGPGYQVPLARSLRAATRIPVGVAGLITTPQQAESILLDGAADVVLAGRQFLRESRFAQRAAAELFRG